MRNSGPSLLMARRIPTSMTDTSPRDRLSATLASAMDGLRLLVVNVGKLVVALGWAAFWLMVARLHLLTQDWVGAIATVAVGSIPMLLFGRSYLPSTVFKAHLVESARGRVGGRGRTSNE